METFEERLAFLIENDKQSMTSFAEKIGAKRANVSHLLSGRNKPSLEFILKIKEAYPQTNLNWLLNGDEQFSPNENSKSKTQTIDNTTKSSQAPCNDLQGKSENNYSENSAPISKEVHTQEKKNSSNTTKQAKSIEQQNPQFDPNQNILNSFTSTSEIEQIVVFYKDGTFKQFKSR